MNLKQAKRMIRILEEQNSLMEQYEPLSTEDGYVDKQDSIDYNRLEQEKEKLYKEIQEGEK